MEAGELAGPNLGLAVASSRISIASESWKPLGGGALANARLGATPGTVIEPVSTDGLLGHLLLSVADYVAGDRLASPSEREAARAHGIHLRKRMRRIEGLFMA